jgi:hypothetical protein
MNTANLQAPRDIDSPYALSSDQIDVFRHQGFIKLKQVFDAPTLAYFGQEITAQVIALNRQHLPMAQRAPTKKLFCR